MLFSTLNTAAEPALRLEPSLSVLLCHPCNRAKWHPAQGAICPHPGAGTGQAQTDPGLCCPRRRYLAVPCGRCPPFPQHCWAAARPQPSSWTLPGQAAGRARVLCFLPHASSAMGRVKHCSKASAGVQTLPRRGNQISDLTVFRRFRTVPVCPARQSSETTAGDRVTCHPHQ